MEGPISFWGYKKQESNLILPEHDDDDNCITRCHIFTHVQPKRTNLFTHTLVSRPRYADKHWLYCFALCELNCIVSSCANRSKLYVSPCANWSQLYYTSCRRGVPSGTELYCFALWELKSTVCFALYELKLTVLHVLSTRSTQWNWTVLFRPVRTEVNSMFRPVLTGVNCITRLVDAAYPVELKPRYLLASLLRTKGKLD